MTKTEELLEEAKALLAGPGPFDKPQNANDLVRRLVAALAQQDTDAAMAWLKVSRVALDGTVPYSEVGKYVFHLAVGLRDDEIPPPVADALAVLGQDQAAKEDEAGDWEWGWGCDRDDCITLHACPSEDSATRWAQYHTVDHRLSAPSHAGLTFRRRRAGPWTPVASTYSVPEGGEQ